MTVLEAAIVATFADQCVALVSPEDRDLAARRWRRDAYGYVLRSQGKRSVFLAREVADRMGLVRGGIGFRDGDPLNCTRSNIWLKKPNMDRRGQSASTHTSQPRGLHRSRLRPLDGASVPPGAYVLRWHQGDCDWTESGLCLLAHTGEVCGIAVRRERHPGRGRATPDGWEFTDLTGDVYPTKNYNEGCRWVLAGRDLTARHAPAVRQGPMLELMRTLEGP